MQVTSAKINPAIECDYGSIGGGDHATQHAQGEDGSLLRARQRRSPQPIPTQENRSELLMVSDAKLSLQNRRHEAACGSLKHAAEYRDGFWIVRCTPAVWSGGRGARPNGRGMVVPGVIICLKGVSRCPLDVVRIDGPADHHA